MTNDTDDGPQEYIASTDFRTELTTMEHHV